MDEKNKKNKWKNKKILGCILTVIIMVAAAAGIYFYMNRFDPVRYVQAVLDVSYKEETEEYSKMTGTSRKEAEAVFEKNLDVTMEKFHSSAISEELEKKYRILFTQIVRQVNYQIGESEKHDDYKYGSQDRAPYDGNVKQHLQSDGTSQYLCQRSRDGSQHCCTQYGTRHPGRSIFGSGFGQAQAGYNAKMRHIMLQYNQHDSG